MKNFLLGKKQLSVVEVEWCFKIFFVHPDRQVYFFASFTQNEVEEFHKYIVIDAETKRELKEGKSYHHCDSPYKK